MTFSSALTRSPKASAAPQGVGETQASHGHRDVTVRGETNLVAFDGGHETAVDIVMMAFVPTLATVSPGQFDAILFDPVDGADMDAVRANHFHMRLIMVIADVPTVAATVNANNRFRVQCFATGSGSPIGTA